MSRMRRALAFRSLLTRVEHLEAAMRDLHDDLEHRRQFDDAAAQTTVLTEQRLHLLEQERLLHALHTGADAAAEVEVHPTVPQSATAPYVCVAPTGTLFHHGWFAVATAVLDAEPHLVAVYGSHVRRAGTELVWQFSTRLADGDTGADTPDSALVLRSATIEGLGGLAGPALVAALAAAGPIRALPHPASLAPGVLERR